MNNATPMEGSSVVLGEQNIVHDGETFMWILIMVMIKHQTLKKSNGMMMVMVVTEIIQELKLIPQIHPSN